MVCGSEYGKAAIWLRVWLLIAFLAGATAAQQDQGVIIGTVTDRSDSLVPGATVYARHIHTNVVASATTNVNGVYFLGPLRIGKYEVSVSAHGFRRSVRSGVHLHANDRLGLNFELELGNIVEMIHISTETPLMNTENSALEHVVNRRQIRQLPLVDRNYQVLALLSAGVLPEIGGRDRGPLQRGGALSSGFTSHGQPALQNNYLLDGVDNNSTVMGMQDRKSQVVVPSLEAVQEFKVHTSNYSAEFGRNAGAVVNISIRGGTNDPHGAMYDYMRNDALDARPTFSYQDRDGNGRADASPLRQHMFGANFGGPIRRNRTFVFGSWEGWRVRLGQADRSIVPTALEKSGDFSQTKGLKKLKDPLGEQFPDMRIPASRMDPVMQSLLTLYPDPNLNDAATRQNYESSPPWRVDREQLDIRLDHRVSDANNLFARLSYYQFDSLRSAPLPGLAQGANNNDRSVDDNSGQHLTISDSHVFSNSVVNEVRFGLKSLRLYKRNEFAIPMTEANAAHGLRVPEPAGGSELYGLSRILFAGSFSYKGLGGAFFQPNRKQATTLQFVDNMRVIRGNHSVTFGADIRYDQTDARSSQNARGEQRFTGRFTGVSFGDGLLGWVERSTLSTFMRGEMRFRSWMLYLQDDWKVTPKFTMNLGLRYELTTPWFEKHNRMNSTIIDPADAEFGRIIAAGQFGGGYEDRGLVNMDTNNFAPRAGFAWRFASKWTLRSGAGVFYGGQMALGASSRTLRNFPYMSSVQVRATNRTYSQLLSNGFAGDFLGTPGNSVDTVDDLPSQSTHRTWDRRFPLPKVFQWNLNLQRELTDRTVLSIAYVGSSTEHISYAYDINSAGIGDPETERERRLFPNLSSLSFRSPLAHATFHGFDAKVERRFAAGFAVTASYTWGHNIGQTPDQFVSGDNGAPQNIQCISCEKGNSSSDVRHRLVASYIYNLPFGTGQRFLNRGGLWNHVAGGWRLTGWFAAQTGMYFSPQLSNSAAYLGTGGVGIWRPDQVAGWRVSDPGPDEWFDPNAFARPCDASGENCRFGSLGRNTLQEPGIIDWTASVAKQFRVSERLRVDFSVEALNVANHPNPGTPQRNLNSPDAGTIRSTQGQPRLIQLGLKLSF